MTNLEFKHYGNRYIQHYHTFHEKFGPHSSLPEPYMTMRRRYDKAEFWDTVSAIATDAKRDNLKPDVFMVWDLMGSRCERSNLASLAIRLSPVRTNPASCERLFSTI